VYTSLNTAKYIKYNQTERYKAIAVELFYDKS